MHAFDIPFAAPLWRYDGEKAAWHFVTLPSNAADEIRSLVGTRRRGWGAVAVLARVGDIAWRTSVFPEKQSGSFLLPIKAAIRQRAALAVGLTVAGCLTIEL